jgi:hypothetical protein
LFLLLLFFGVLKWVLDFNSSVEEEEARPCRRRSGSLTAKDMAALSTAAAAAVLLVGLKAKRPKTKRKRREEKK